LTQVSGNRFLQMQHTKRGRGTQGQPAARLLGLFASNSLGFLDLLQDIDATFQVYLTDLGEADAPRGAVEQAGTKMLFELHNRLADLRTGQADLVCSGAESGCPGNFDKDLHAVETIHIVNYKETMW
jgi:hypothetical protein